MKSLISVLAILLIMKQAIAQNEVPNGNFESWYNSKLTDWVPEYWETNNYFEYPTTIPDSNAFEGNLAMRVRPEPGFEGATPQTAGVIFAIDGIPSSFHFAVRTNVPDLGPYDEVSVQIEFLNEDAIIGSEIWTSTETIDEWQEINLPFAPLMFTVNESRITVKAGYLGALGGGSIDTWISVDDMSLDVITGIDDTPLSTIQVYPNPSSNFIIVEGIGNSTSIQIFDASGRDCSSLIQTNKLGSTNKINLDVSALASGLYQVVVYDVDPAKVSAITTFLKR